MFRYLTLLAIASVCQADVIWSAGYSTFAGSGTAIFGSAGTVPDDFLGPGTSVPAQDVILTGQPGSGGFSPASNLTGQFTIWDEPLPQFFLGGSPGCCGLVLHFPTGGAMPIDPPPTAIPFTVVEVRLAGNITVLRNGSPETWGYTATLADPADGTWLAFGTSSTTAQIVAGSLSLHLIETFTSPDGASFQRSRFEGFPEAQGQLQTIPEPGSLSLLLAGAACIAVSAVTRTQRDSRAASRPAL